MSYKVITSSSAEQDVEKAISHCKDINIQLARTIAEFKVVQKTTRELDFLTKSAKERYLNLLNDHPNFVQEIPNKRIALYLGIHPESLSRIKKELFR